MTTNSNETLTLKKIFIFWAPLAATWLMMSVEGPLLSALIARMAEPKFNLAAYGVAFAIALFIEAPIIMMMSASVALVEDNTSYRKLRNFTFLLNFLITVLMLLLIYPPFFFRIAYHLLQLPAKVARLTHLACIFLIPWPAAIGFRRFYQGILIRQNLTRRVAYGTMIRLTTMTTIALLFFFFLDVPGVVVGAAALGTGVTFEALATRLMTGKSIRRLVASNQAPETTTPRLLSYRYIANFYFPLALTPMIALGAQPVVTFFLSHSRMALESLAVFPVVHSLVFIFRSMGLSFMEVTVSLMGPRWEGAKPLRHFAIILGTTVVLLCSLIAFTPLSSLWFHSVSGLSMELTRFAKVPTEIFAVMPGLSVWLSYQRGSLVNAHRTKPITIATVIEVTGIIVLLWLTIHQWGWVGAVAGTFSLVLGRFLANGFLSLVAVKARRSKI